jgi:hypothetical protein
MIAFLLGDLPVIEAARSLTKRTTHSTSIFDLRTRKSLLWSLINKIAVDLPLVQPRIVDLLQIIRTLKPTKEGSNTVCPNDTWSILDRWINMWADLINSKTSFNHFIYYIPIYNSRLRSRLSMARGSPQQRHPSEMATCYCL